MSDTVTTVIFVRHAQPLYPYADDRTRPLMEEGLSDRKLVAETLKGRRIDAFLCSPYTRSLDTIRPAAEMYGQEIVTDERFAERRGGPGGDAVLRRRWEDFDFAEEGGENLASVQKRNVEALREVLRDFNGKTVVIGTHGTALSMMLNYFYPSFGVGDFLRIVELMPYIVEVRFGGERALGMRELAYLDKSSRGKG